MIFKDTYRYVLDSTKTQTRRLKKPGDYIHAIGPFQEVIRNDRLLWRVGRTYAVQPTRGEKAVGRIVLNAIRKELLRDISAEDCIAAEGLISYHREHAAVVDLQQQFEMLWNGIHTLKGQRWNDNPEVWVLEFDLVR